MEMIKKYAHLLVNYSLSLNKGERVLIKTTTLAEDLAREVYREAIKISSSAIRKRLSKMNLEQ